MSKTSITQASKRSETKLRIMRAAAGLLAREGREAVTTRAVAAAAGVQAPTIYRQFGDMKGLLDEVTAFGFSTYLSEETTQEVVEDPVEALRQGWDLHVSFGLANPPFYKLMYGDPSPGAAPTAACEADEILYGHIQRIAEAGRLRVSVRRAAEMVRAAGTGFVLTAIAREPEHRDPDLSAAIRDVIFEAITTSGSDKEAKEMEGRERVVNRAVALKAILSDAESDLTSNELSLLSEWLDRLAGAR